MDLNASVIVPAFNESTRINSVLRDLKKTGYEVIVVDDGSSDDTAERAELYDFRCIRLKSNMGKGYACRAGAEQASHEKIVFFDSDGQFDVREIYRMLEALNSFDMVLGFRDFRSVPIQRKLSNWFARKVISSVCGNPYQDALCGMRGIRKSALNRMFLEKDRYEFESELLIKASRAGLRIGEVPVSVKYLTGNRGMPVSHSFRITRYIMKELVKSKVKR